MKALSLTIVVLFILTSTPGSACADGAPDNSLSGQCSPIPFNTSLESGTAGDAVISTELVLEKRNQRTSVRPPMTQNALVLEYDAAVLIGTSNAGKNSKAGFYLSTSYGSPGTRMAANKLRQGAEFNKLAYGLMPKTTYYFTAYEISGGVERRSAVRSFTTPAYETWTAKSAILMTSAERYYYIFGTQRMYYDKYAPPLGYIKNAEASKHLVKVTVPVWKIKHGKRISSTYTILVHRKLAKNVKAIFSEIYLLDIKFPIMQLTTYKYRTVRGPGLAGSPVLSHHSWGTAIDINKPYNGFYSKVDKRNPKSPYTIPQQVADIFAKYGWSWGMYFAEGKDTMHFQYLGLELTESR